MVEGIKTYFNIKNGGEVISSHQIFGVMCSQFDGISSIGKSYLSLRQAFEKNSLIKEFVLPCEKDHESANDINLLETDDFICMQRVVQRNDEAFHELSSSWSHFILESKLVNMQMYFVESWKQFITITNTLFDTSSIFEPFSTSNYNKENRNLSLSPNVKSQLFPKTPKENKLENSSILKWSASRVHHVVAALEKHYHFSNEVTILNTSPPYLKKNVVGLSTLYIVRKITRDLLETMLSALHDYSKFYRVDKNNYKSELRNLFHNVMNIAEKLFDLIKPSQYKSAEFSVVNNNLVNAEVEEMRKKGLMVSLCFRIIFEGKKITNFSIHTFYVLI